MADTLWRRLPGHGPWIIGHRGTRDARVENTLEAFEIARAQGAQGVELDVRLARDGQVMVIHDATLERLSQGRDRRMVEALDGSELAQALGDDMPEIPRLEAVLEWAARHEQLVNIELKRDVKARGKLVDAVCELVLARPKLHPQLLLSTFDPFMVRACSARVAPKVAVAWLLNNTRSSRAFGFGNRYRWFAADGVHPSVKICDRKALSSWRATGGLVNVWTVNDVEAAERLAQAGVDALITDVPERLVQARLGAPPAERAAGEGLA